MLPICILQCALPKTHISCFVNPVLKITLNWNLFVLNRRRLLIVSGAIPLVDTMSIVASAADKKNVNASDVLFSWYELTLELVRHTATYSPPVAARAFAYLGIAAFEAVASGSSKLSTLAGQLPQLEALPKRQTNTSYNEAVVMHVALLACVRNLFNNTGPAGKRAIASLQAKLEAGLVKQGKTSTRKRSTEFGNAIAAHILNWSKGDGGTDIKLMGFASDYKVDDAPGHWKPTGPIQLQQLPLLPKWGDNRTFAMANAASCSLPPPPSYSEDKSSDFYKEALETYDTVKSLTPEQKLIARFWSDDPMLSPTPPGHWLFIALDLLKEKSTGVEDSVDVLARLGMAVSDGFVTCWKSKYDYDLLRPVTYIKKVFDKTWEPLLITPPFPEYPSGHSTQSGAAAAVLTQFFGENFAFEDRTHVREKFKGRPFKSFWEAANEAGISRLYGGIHFRAAIDRGLDQGRCVGAAVNALKTRPSA
jgi:PAP2 superfamily/Vanadium chloroperoxidase N-terminal domain